MSERDRQNPYGRSEQQGGGYRSESDSPQANQWQGETFRQQGSDWQQDGSQRGGSNDTSRDYRFSGQGNQAGGDFDSRDYGREHGSSSYGESYAGGRQDFSRGGSQDHRGTSSYRGQLSEDDLRGDQRDASRNYERARGGYGPDHDRGGRNWQGGSQGRQDRGTQGYSGQNYDASGGNDFGSFTSEDFGGRDFSNRGGGISGGARSSESYRPSYGVGAWLGRDDDDRQRRNRSGSNRGSAHEDYGSWRQYGESRGFLERASDEVASWFGNEDASRRRDQDHRQDGRQDQQQSHRGRGPSNYTRSDERIRDDANDHLTHDHLVDASHITVTVKDGELTLDGTVDSRQAKRQAEDCVEHISGVKHVQNNLRVQDRSANSSSGSYGSGSYGSSGSGLAGSSTSSLGQNTGTSGLSGGTGTSSQGTGTGASSSALGGTTGSSSTGGSSVGGSSGGGASSSTSSTGGANTTEGIGSTTTAGVGSASSSRPSDKTS